MSNRSEHKRVSGQKIVGMQVIDNRGTLIGTVKDVGVDLDDKQLLLYVSAKDKSEIEIPGNKIHSIEDVILVREMGAAPTAPPVQSMAEPSTISCPNCNATLPAHAKFCAKCGSKIT